MYIGEVTLLVMCTKYRVHNVLPQAVCECVSSSEVGQTESLPLLQQLLGCVIAITSASGPDCHLHSAPLFSTLLRIAASRHSPTLKTQVRFIVHNVWPL